MLNPAEDIVAAPPSPSRLGEILDALKRVGPLAGLSDDEFAWLAIHGKERTIPSGDVLFHEGDPVSSMSILLKGEIQVRRERGGPAALFIGRAGQITGLMPFSRMKTFGGTGFTTAETWALEYDRSLFPAMLAAIPSMGQRIVSILLDRVREVTRMEQQGEKLTALGKLAGNLAHELNNPASAAQRAASGMLLELRTFGRERYRLGGLCFSPEQARELRLWEDRVRAETKAAAPLAPLALAGGREDAIDSWLRSHSVPDASAVATDLAEGGIAPAHLDALPPFLSPEAISVVLSQFASSLRAERIAEAMLDSSARIFDLIRAIKDYSYMDQAPVQDIDVPQSLENTLAMLQSRLGRVTLTREYQDGLPLLAAYGSELNQVWTELIENALDAMAGHGDLRIGVHTHGEYLLVEVENNGPGIPPELQARIFEPFFTTKSPGSGLGLGLDTAQRIVRMHRGFINVESRPGRTCFQVRLPLHQPDAY